MNTLSQSSNKESGREREKKKKWKSIILIPCRRRHFPFIQFRWWWWCRLEKRRKGQYPARVTSNISLFFFLARSFSAFAASRRWTLTRRERVGGEERERARERPTTRKWLFSFFFSSLFPSPLKKKKNKIEKKLTGRLTERSCTLVDDVVVPVKRWCSQSSSVGNCAICIFQADMMGSKCRQRRSSAKDFQKRTKEKKQKFNELPSGPRRAAKSKSLPAPSHRPVRSRLYRKQNRWYIIPTRSLCPTTIDQKEKKKD